VATSLFAKQGARFDPSAPGQDHNHHNYVVRGKGISQVLVALAANLKLRIPLQSANPRIISKLLHVAIDLLVETTAGRAIQDSQAGIEQPLLSPSQADPLRDNFQQH
jgi:hypothetical protein